MCPECTAQCEQPCPACLLPPHQPASQPGCACLVCLQVAEEPGVASFRPPGRQVLKTSSSSATTVLLFRSPPKLCSHDLPILLLIHNYGTAHSIGRETCNVGEVWCPSTEVLNRPVPDPNVLEAFFQGEREERAWLCIMIMRSEGREEKHTKTR